MQALRLLSSGAIRYPRSATKLPMCDAPDIFAALKRDPAPLQKGVLMLEEGA